jgi:hypothetical protein
MKRLRHSPFLATRSGSHRVGSLIAGLALSLLTGCASVYRVDSQVQSFARWSNAATPTAAAATNAIPQAPQLYRFERLPSQAAENAARGQADLEAIARTALAKRGWTRADPGVSARWSVQVNGGTLKLPRAPWEEPWDGFGYGGGFGGFGGLGIPGRNYVVTGSGQVIWTPVFMRLDLPYYERKVSLLIRNAGNGQVVYETHAAHDGRWNSSPELWGAMLDAALQDFPAPPAGVRQVNIDLPR